MGGLGWVANGKLTSKRHVRREFVGSDWVPNSSTKDVAESTRLDRTDNFSGMEAMQLNPRIKALGEIVIRVRDLQRALDFYTTVIGLDVLRTFEGITFLQIANGYGGHTQIIGLFHESIPTAFKNAERGQVDIARTSLHHFAFEIDKSDYAAELDRLKGLGAEVATATHPWCHWRSIYVKDPEGNIVELVCYDETVG
jgi:catechol-2,3-dioxygenase